MQTFTLSAKSRKETGHKAKQLRKSGVLPATVYGKKITSESVSIQVADFTGVYEKAGETGLVELSLDGKTRPVLIHNVQKHPLTGEFLHAELLQVNLKEKVHTRVSLEFTGVSPAVADKTGTILTLVDELEIEALPTDLPDHIDVDVSGLAQVNQEIKVKDISAPSGVMILTEPEVSVIRIGELITKEEEVAAPEPVPTEVPADSEKEAPAAAAEAPEEKPKE